jgi:hypothetical protein
MSDDQDFDYQANTMDMKVTEEDGDNFIFQKKSILY